MVDFVVGSLPLSDDLREPFIDSEDLPAIRAGASITTIVNPITCSVIKITGGADTDTAEVYSVPESRTVTCR